MHGYTTATCRLGSYIFSFPRISYWYCWCLYHLCDHGVPDEKLSSLPRTLLPSQQIRAYSALTGPSKSTLCVENLSVVTHTGPAGFVRHFPLTVPSCQKGFIEDQAWLLHTCRHAIAHVQEPLGVLPLRLEAMMCHMLLAVYSYPRV
jgi:hypothetical protein